jgi:hypothetical protein
MPFNSYGHMSVGYVGFQKLLVCHFTKPEQGIAPALSPKVTPLPASQIHFARLGTLPFENLLELADILAYLQTLTTPPKDGVTVPVKKPNLYE